jgi:glyoxylase-like metal-dependent hydrolase (beta-lactamase superfamily II)
MLENHCWQPIPGLTSGTLFPVLRRPDATCANAFLLQTSECLAVIDPGADPEQTARIRDVLDARLYEKPRPVLLLLTHCHRDHAWACADLLAADLPAWVLGQETGMQALASGDSELTLAYLFNETAPRFSHLLPLLTKTDLANPGERSLQLVDGPAFRLQTHRPSSGLATDPGDQTLALGDDVVLTITPTPGHSPDSVTYWVGDLCFPGDLLLAANPGVAGIPGWSADAWVNSLARVAQRSAERGLQWACVGHGPPLPAAVFRNLLTKLTDQPGLRQPVVRLDADRADYLKQYAVAALGEAAELLTVIAGRLQFIVFQLERLEEAAEAQRIARLLDDAAIDAVLTGFQQTVAAPEVARLTMALPLKGLQVIGKIQALFQEEALQGLIDPAWLHRVRFLINDYAHTLQGLPATALSVPVDVNPLIVSVLSALQRPRVPRQALFDTVEDPTAFARTLAARIGQPNRYQALAIHAGMDLGLPPVKLDPAALEDALLSVVERLTVHSAGTLLIETALDATEENVLIRLTTDLRNLPDVLGVHRRARLELSLQRYGGRLRFMTAATGDSIVLEFPVAVDG